MRKVASPLPSMVFTPPSVPPFPGDRNPSGEGSTNSLSSLLKNKSQSVLFSRLFSSPTGTNGRCSAIVEGKQRAN